MTLSSLVVSRDWPEVSVLECILGGLHIGVEVEPEPARARAKLAKSKIDALIVDCDLDGTRNILRGLEEKMNTVPLVIIGGANSQQLKSADATFVFEKPISVEQAVRTLSAARNLILDGRLRYHRHSIEVPASVTPAKGRRLKVKILNLSQGGVAVEWNRAAPLTGKFGIEFKLPGSAAPFKAKGKVVWTREDCAGVHFVEMSHRLQRDLHLWLAQQYLRH
jgi:PilZ domain